jgi:hypothetical protein
MGDYSVIGLAQRDQRLAVVDMVADRDQHLFDNASLCAANGVVHLHRLERAEQLPNLNDIARFDSDDDDIPGQRRSDDVCLA